MKIESTCIQCNRSFIKYSYERYTRCKECRDANYQEKNGVTKEERILKIAKIILKNSAVYNIIPWESCSEYAKIQSLKQAEAVYNYLFA